MRANLTAFAAASSIALLCACSTSTPAANDGDDVVTVASTQSRITQPDVPAADAAALRDGDTAFAADLYQTLRANPAFADENVFFSPHSISLALAMTYGGARGETEAQMAKTMHYTLPQAKLHSAFDALDLDLSSRGQGAQGADGKAFRLRVTNSMWGAPQTKFQDAYLDLLAQNYGAGIRLTDFQADPEAARKTINSWVDHETEDRIQDLLAPGTIVQDTRFVLVNAIYFNAAWATPFEKSATHAGVFHGVAGDTPADLMSRTERMEYAKGDGWQAVSLTYDGGESFVAVVPDQFSSFESSFTADQASSIVSSFAGTEVQLELPKFKIEGNSFSLKDALVGRGMTDLFDPALADLSGIATEKLWVSDVIHQATVSVDESGTEAAAATAVIGVGGAMAPTDMVKLTIDRPFLFFIRDNATGTILFLGRVVKI